MLGKGQHGAVRHLLMPITKISTGGSSSIPFEMPLR